MSDSDTEGFFDNEWDECGDLVWNEFDWERYLREQDDLLHRYLAHYEQLPGQPDRIDEVARLLGWDAGPGGADPVAASEETPSGNETAEAPTADANSLFEPYTLHKHPVFIATKAIYLSLKRSWERIASDGAKVPQPLALAVQTSLHRGEEHAILGVQALDLGDFAMAVSLFKRALEELNRTLALAHDPTAGAGPHLATWRDDAIPRLFDLREIWLRVMSECRAELARRADGEE
jgi:hypothetical protein